MSIYSISDLHLSFGMDKPMSVFGKKWEDYEEKLRANWETLIRSDDVVVLPGDFSWGMHLKETLPDFSFLNSLPGIKILSKGNHDYWWETANKLNSFVAENQFTNIHFLHNNAYLFGEVAVCGTKGWALAGEEPEDEKIFRRELSRLELSLNQAIQMGAKEILLFLHYPPFLKDTSEDPTFLELVQKYPITTCAYGHLHGLGALHAYKGTKNGVFYLPVSCDLVDFTPVLIKF